MLPVESPGTPRSCPPPLPPVPEPLPAEPLAPSVSAAPSTPVANELERLAASMAASSALLTFDASPGTFVAMPTSRGFEHDGPRPRPPSVSSTLPAKARALEEVSTGWANTTTFV